MPKIGREVPAKAECTNPRFSNLNICPTPWWTLFIRTYTVWQCPKCSRKYRLDWLAGGADAIKSWERWDGTK